MGARPDETLDIDQVDMVGGEHVTGDGVRCGG